MGFSKNILYTGIALILAAGLTGCGQAYKGTETSSASTATETNGDLSVGGGSTANIDDAMAKAEAANKSAEAAMVEAQAALNDIIDSKGNLKISIFSKSSTQQKGLLSPIVDKLRKVFDKVFAKIEEVKAKYTEARRLLADALAKLDRNNPLQAALYEKIMGKLAAIDKMEAKLRSVLKKVADKLDLVEVAIEKVLEGVTSFIPGFGWIADMLLDFAVMDDVRELIAELKARLLAI